MHVSVIDTVPFYSLGPISLYVLSVFHMRFVKSKGLEGGGSKDWRVEGAWAGGWRELGQEGGGRRSRRGRGMEGGGLGGAGGWRDWRVVPL